MQHPRHDVLTRPDRLVVSCPIYHASLHGASARIGLVIVGTAPIGQGATKGNDCFSSRQGDASSLVGAKYIFSPDCEQRPVLECRLNSAVASRVGNA
jgi:hypothetical protein